MRPFWFSNFYVLLTIVVGRLFTGPSDGICPGDDVTFTCVANVAVTLWTVTPGGTNAVCTYRQAMPTATVSCGPGGRFTSSQTDENGDTNNSSLSVVSITNDLNGTSVICADGNDNLIGNGTICVVDVLESATIQSATVSGFGQEENMCQLSLEWSEAIVSCGGNVSYTVTVSPCLSGPGDCDVINGSPVSTFSTTDTQQTVSVNGSFGLEYNFTVSTCANTSLVCSVDLTASSNGNESFYYYYIYSNDTPTIQTITVTWPRHYVLDRETSYRVIINEQGIDEDEDMTSQNCTREMCTYIHYPKNLTLPPDSVSVDIMGCTTESEYLMDISTTNFCSPEDLFPPDVDRNKPVFNGTVAVYSFTGGNVTYDGVFPGSTATYTASEGYLINGTQSMERECSDDYTWMPEGLPIIRSRECNFADLLPCENPINITETICCVDENGETKVCIENQVSIGSFAKYSNGKKYCILNETPRMCNSNMMWDGELPSITKVSVSAPFGPTNTSLVTVGLILFFPGLIGLVLVLVLLIKNHKKCQWWHWVTFGIAVVYTVVVAGLFLGLLGYSVNNDFLEDDGYKQMQDSNICERPSGKVAVRNGLVITCFVLGLLTSVLWTIYLIITKCTLGYAESPYREKQRCELMCCQKGRERQQQAAMYESVDPPSSTQPPVTYEEVGVAREVKRSQDIQLTSNEAYGPIQKDNIQTSPNTAYGQVHL